MERKILYTILGIVVLSAIVIILNQNLIFDGSYTMFINRNPQVDISVSNDQLPTWFDNLLSQKGLMIADACFTIILGAIYVAVLYVTKVFQKEKISIMLSVLLLVLPIIISITILAVNINSHVHIVA